MRPKRTTLANRFRGFLPIVIDVETSGLNPETDAILEIAAIILRMNDIKKILVHDVIGYHVEPFLGANLNPESMAIHKIDPHYPLRYAITEKQALHNLFTKIKNLLIKHGCQRAILVGHNSWFDLQFLQAAAKRCGFRDIPFHAFTSIDTASLAVVTLGETVLAKAAKKAGIGFDINLAHSAIYDALRTAELFCSIVNRLSN